jgi:hypothetical protein
LDVWNSNCIFIYTMVRGCSDVYKGTVRASEFKGGCIIARYYMQSYLCCLLLIFTDYSLYSRGNGLICASISR